MMERTLIPPDACRMLSTGWDVIKYNPHSMFVKKDVIACLSLNYHTEAQSGLLGRGRTDRPKRMHRRKIVCRRCERKAGEAWPDFQLGACSLPLNTHRLLHLSGEMIGELGKVALWWAFPSNAVASNSVFIEYLLL